MIGLRDSLLRLLPHAISPGLRAIGNPGPDAPVMVTGNYALTVRRLQSRLAGHDVWLLVANSRGINVWCAAGGGHFTHHDIIAAVRAAHLTQHVHHRLLILPQLAATGVESRRILEATGFEGRWGPARLEDLPEFLERGCRVKNAHRLMRFPTSDRLEMATMWAVPMAALAAAVLALVVNVSVALVTAVMILAAVYTLFLLLPRVPVVGAPRWVTFLLTATLSTWLGTQLLVLVGAASMGSTAALAVSMVMACILLSADIAGTTPVHPSTINSFRNHFRVELVEQRCTGAAACVQVCPRNVLQMDGPRHQVEIRRPDHCILCGACIVQCPQDALRFRYADGSVIEPNVVRSTHLNLLGRRRTDRAG